VIDTGDGGSVSASYDVDVVVSVEDGSFNFIFSGSTAPDEVFGNNGVRWTGVKFTSGQTKQFTYKWSTGVSIGTDYVVVVSGSRTTKSARGNRARKTAVLNIHYGRIEPLTARQAYSTSVEGLAIEDLQVLPQGIRELLEKRKPKPPKPPR
jgi:hypothetical protein